VGPLDLLLHLLSFVAPAAVVALLVAAAARIVLPASLRPSSWWTSVAINAITGVVVLALGLWAFGRDGKMLTYGALVLAVATVQWLSGRAWRS
jgi:hypothetical protein